MVWLNIAEIGLEIDGRSNRVAVLVWFVCALITISVTCLGANLNTVYMQLMRNIDC